MAPPVPRHKTPVASDKTLSHWLALSQTLPKKWPLGHYTLQEVEHHASEDDCWIVLNGLVFDITPYLSYHPGGREILLEHAGQDITRPFREYHSWVNWERILESCLVGRLVP